MGRFGCLTRQDGTCSQRGPAQQQSREQRNLPRHHLQENTFSGHTEIGRISSSSQAVILV